jgi:serine/threonine-protein phosphatase 2A regulatory subunit A
MLKANYDSKYFSSLFFLQFKIFFFLCKVVEPEYLRQELVSLFTNLANDEQDSVRLLAIEAGIAMASLFRHEDLEQQMMQTLRSATDDKSWRVRYVVADKLVDVSC